MKTYNTPFSSAEYVSTFNISFKSRNLSLVKFALYLLSKNYSLKLRFFLLNAIFSTLNSSITFCSDFIVVMTLNVMNKNHYKKL